MLTYDDLFIIMYVFHKVDFAFSLIFPKNYDAIHFQLLSFISYVQQSGEQKAWLIYTCFIESPYWMVTNLAY